MAKLFDKKCNPYECIRIFLVFLQRRLQYVQQQPDHLPEAMYLAGKGFVHGVALGLSGVVTQPVRGMFSMNEECGQG